MKFTLSRQKAEDFTIKEILITWVLIPMVIGFIIGTKIREWFE